MNLEELLNAATKSTAIQKLPSEQDGEHKYILSKGINKIFLTITPQASYDPGNNQLTSKLLVKAAVPAHPEPVMNISIAVGQKTKLQLASQIVEQCNHRARTAAARQLEDINTFWS